jgi:cell division protein FtsI (penicillin-binding protein 3)
VLIVALMVMSVIGGRLIELQGLDRSVYATSAIDQRLHTLALPATRGTITDRDGAPLAETVDADDVVADPSQINDVGSVADALAPVLHIGSAQLVAALSVGGQYALLAHAVEPSVADRVNALKLPGITTVDTSKRIYPDGSLASNVLGFVNAAGAGRGGIELGYQRELAGRNGLEHFQVSANGVPIPDGENVVRAAVPGSGIRLTLQRDVQYEAQRAITKQVQATRADSGTVIVMNPTNGQIVAMATAPGFNPNNLAKANPNHIGNPAITDVYEPGSVNKVITMSAALQSKLVTPISPFVIPPVLTDAGTTFHDAESHGTERLTLTGILAYSSNIGAIQVAKLLGPQRMYHFLRAYGFGSVTGVGLPGEQQGLLPPVSQWSGTTLPTVSFGQGIGVTAMQVASVYATIANGGVRVTPNVVEGMTGPSGAFTPAPPPVKRRVISAKVAKQMRDMMESVISEQGTAPEAAIPGFRIAGKTGTADRPNGHGGYAGYTASFVGMAPADKPKLVCEVVLQNPRTGHFGGQVAAPVFKTVMSFALRSLGIAPTFTKPPKAKLRW